MQFCWRAQTQSWRGSRIFLAHTGPDSGSGSAASPEQDLLGQYNGVHAMSQVACRAGGVDVRADGIDSPSPQMIIAKG